MSLSPFSESIASMSMYHDQWPLLVLTPSSARYHWEAEFQQWLGAGSPINKKIHDLSENSFQSEGGEGEKDEEIPAENYKPQMQLLEDSEIHVLTSGKGHVFPAGRRTRVVICSYGLAPSMIESGALRPGMFGCAIVDER